MTVQCSCGSSLWERCKAKKFEGFTDCRDYLPSVPAKCSNCGIKRKLLREFVSSGSLSEQVWREKVGLSSD